MLYDLYVRTTDRMERDVTRIYGNSETGQIIWLLHGQKL